MSARFIPTRNDLSNLEKLRDDYSDGAGKGFIHGFQKDLIQNSTGARYKNKKFNSFWQITIELKKINNKYCLIATDKGTTGLIGGAFSEDARDQKLGSEWSGGNIPANEALTRFLNLDFSGGGQGAGSKGQGKGLYNMLSSRENDHCFIFDSVQVGPNGEAGDYLCGRKWIDNVELKVDFKTPEDPYDIGSLKQDYIKDFKKWTNNELQPLKEVGTRIIVYGIDTTKKYSENNDLTFLQIFENSFIEGFKDPDYNMSFYNMIQETWWEIILKKGAHAKFVLKLGDKTRVVELDERMDKIYNAKKGEHENHIKKEVSDIELNYEGLKIKKLSLVYFKKKVKGLKQGIYVNRRWMRVGNSLPIRRLFHGFNEQFYGYVELEEETENEVCKHENNIHYGFRPNEAFMKHYFNKVLNEEYNIFKSDCGLGERGSRSHNQSIRDSYLQIAEKLNFAAVSSWAPSNKAPEFQIKISKMVKSSVNWSVNYTDTIGPISLDLINNEDYDLDSASLLVLFEQERGDSVLVFKQENLLIEKNSSYGCDVPRFDIPSKLTYERVVKLKIVLQDSLGTERAKNTRLVWLGINEPENSNTKEVKISSFSADLPSQNTTRVNIGEVIKNLNCSLISNVNEQLSCVLSADVTYNQNGRKTLFVHHQKDIVFGPGAELSEVLPELIIDERFSLVSKREVGEKNREVKIQLTVVSNDDYPSLGVQKGTVLSNKKDFTFYIEYDPVGKGPFSDFRNVNDSALPKSSHKQISNNEFHFIINFGHRCWTDLGMYGSHKDQLEEEYRQTEIAKQAVLLCIENNKTDNVFFKTPTNDGLSTYKECFENEGATPAETIKYIDELIDKILD